MPLDVWAQLKLFQSEAKLSEHMPYLRYVADDVMMLRQGDLMATLRLDGLNSMTADDAVIDVLKNHFAAVVSVAGDTFGFYVHRMTVGQDMALPPVTGDSFVGEIDKRWQSHIKGLNQKKQRLFLSVVRRPSLAARLPFLSRFATRDFRKDLDTRMDQLNQVVQFCSEALQEANAVRLTRHGPEWLGVLAGINTGTYAGVYEAQSFTSLADQTATNRVIFDGDQIRLHDTVTGANRYGAIFGIKNYGSFTDAVMFDGLDFPTDVVLTNAFTGIPGNLMMESIQRIIRQMDAAETAAISLRDELVQAADNLESGRMAFGKHHCSVAVYGESPDHLDQIIARTKRVGQEAGLVLVREGMANASTFFAQHPGNFKYRARKAALSTVNFADMAAFHGTNEGRCGEESPWGTNVTTLPSVGSSGYRFNFHEPGDQEEEPTAGHAVVIGSMGSGKTVTTAFLAAQARRVEGMRLFFFDKDQGLEMAVRAMGGTYRQIRAGVPTGLNPLATETDARGQAWLGDWLIPLLSRDDNLSGEQAKRLQQAIRQNAGVANPALRNFTGFRQLFQSLDDDEELLSRVDEWVPGGRFGWVFEEATDEEAIRIDHDVIGFDMTEILDMERERMAVLSYVFRMIERVLEDRKPTMIILDEAWKLLNDSYFVSRLENWLVTLRKLNCVVVMLTQLPSQLEKSAVGKTIVETVTTQLLFPNPKAVPEDYAFLRCGEKEARLLVQPTLGMRTALIRSAGDSVFVNTDLSALGGLVRVLGGGATGEHFFGPDWRSDPDFWRKE